MRQGTLIAVAALCCLALLTAAKAGLSDRQNAAPAASRWRVSPLVRAGSEVPDVAGARFQEFGEVFWLDSGEVVFWGGWGKRDEDWGLFSLKDGKLRTISRAGEGVIPPSIQQIPGRKPDKISLHRFAHNPTWKGGLHIKTPIHAGKNHLYLSVEEIYQVMSGAWNSGVYAWDGLHLKKLLGADGEFIGSEMGGVKYEGINGIVLTVSTQGEALIYFMGGPKGLKAIGNMKYGLALYDGSQLKPLLVSGDPLPGMPGVKLSDVEYGHAYSTPWADKPLSAAWASPEATLAVLKVDGAPYKKALFRLTRDKAEKLVAVGDPDPADPKKSIKEIMLIEAAGPETVAVLVERSGRGGLAWLLHHQGQLRLLFDISMAERETGWDGLALGKFAFIRTDPAQALLEATVIKSKLEWRNEYYKIVLVAHRSFRTDYYVYDGQRVARVSRDTSFFDTRLRWTFGDFPGAIIEGVRLNWLTGATKDVTEAEFQKNVTASFLDFSAKEMRPQPPPEFVTEDGRRIPIADVLAWKGRDGAVARLGDGLHLLTKKQD
jgi:hypothetical protein